MIRPLPSLLLLIAIAAQASPEAEKLGIDRPIRPQVDAPYAPADGATVSRNPPSFVFVKPNGWQPDQFTYLLEWSQSPDFPEDRTDRLTGLPYHVNIPDRALTPGRWYWRYGVENQPGGTVRSRTRSFIVPENAPVLPYPDIDRVTMNIDRGHPRLYLSAADLPAVRERAKNGDLRPLVENMKQWLTPHLGKELVVEPDFLPPRRDPNYLAVYADVFRTTRPDQNRMNLFALYYLMTGDRAFGEEAKRRILHFFVKWNPEGATALENNDEPAMSIVWWGLPAYDWTWDLFTPEERAAVERSMQIRMNQFYDHLRKLPIDAHPYNSHAIYYYQLMGRLALMLIPEHPEAKKCFDYSLRLFWTFLHPYSAPDGGWSEGPGYGSWGVERLFRYVHIVRHTTGIDLMRIQPFFRYCGYYPLIGWPGPSRQTSFGDGTSPSSQADMLRICAAMNQDPVFLKAGLDRRQPLGASIWAVLTDTAGLGKPDMSRLPTAWQFPSIGFAALRTDLENFDNDVGLLFQSNPYGAVSHHHNCHNCFMLEAYGEPLAISSGYYDHYNSPHHDGWTRQTKARNGITVDGGLGQMRGGHAVGRLTQFEHGRDFDIVTGDASAAYEMLDTSFRTIVHVRPGIFVIRDRATAPAPQRFEYQLHGLRPGEFDETAQTVTLKMPKAELLVRFFADRPWKFSSFDRFPIPPNRPKPESYPEQWHFTAAAPEPSRTLELLTVLLPYRTGEANRLPEVEKLADGIRFRYADGHTAAVRFNGDRVITEKNAPTSQQ